MSAAIKNALMNLDKAVNNAESALLRRQKAPPKPAATPMPDLFSASQKQPGTTGLGFDRNLLARKLDLTIAKVEQLLGEA
ncbi:MAG TPA: hypothetical protein VIF12_06780 [Micavibrio sp.]